MHWGMLLGTGAAVHSNRRTVHSCVAYRVICPALVLPDRSFHMWLRRATRCW